MKKPIYFYVLLVLSAIGAVTNGMTFLSSSQLPQAQQTGNAQVDAILQQSVEVVQRSAEIAKGLPSLLLYLLATLLFIVAAVLLFRKDIIKASYLYLASLVVGFGHQIYSYVATLPLLSIYTDEAARNQAAFYSKVAMGVYIVVFLIFAGLILFKLFRYKNAQEEAQA